MVVESLRGLSEQHVRRRPGDRGYRYLAGNSRDPIPGIRMGFLPIDREYRTPTVQRPAGKRPRSRVGLSRRDLEQGLQTLLEGSYAASTRHGIAGLSPDFYQEEVGHLFVLPFRISRCERLHRCDTKAVQVNDHDSDHSPEGS